MDLLSLFVDAALVRNLALALFLGMCMLLAVSRRVDTAAGFGLAVLVVQAVTVPLNNLLHRHVLAPGALAWAGLPEVDLGYLTLVCFVGLIAATVQLLELVLERFTPGLARRFGIFLPLITVNCAVLGGSLFMVQRDLDLVQSVVYGLGTGAGWALALLLLAGLRERLATSDPPAGLRGLGLTFIVAGLVSLSFMAFAGMELS